MDCWFILWLPKIATIHSMTPTLAIQIRIGMIGIMRRNAALSPRNKFPFHHFGYKRDDMGKQKGPVEYPMGYWRRKNLIVLTVSFFFTWRFVTPMARRMPYWFSLASKDIYIYPTGLQNR